MNLLFDFIPIALFFIFYKIYNIYVATIVAMIASLFQLCYVWLKQRKIEKTLLMTLVAILVLGSATLIFHNDVFIKWKPTVIYWFISFFILTKSFLGKGPTTKALLQDKILLDDKRWVIIDNLVIVFMAFLGALNITIAYNYSTNTWVYFKLFGALGLTLIFCVSMSFYIAKYAHEIESND
ncbi:MAG: septation protein A [Pseudomonadota bacterium]|nr:septation protein A [Pseudomonadota bacterium]